MQKTITKYQSKFDRLMTSIEKDKPRKRPGRHKKNRNKHEKRMGKYRGKRG